MSRVHAPTMMAATATAQCFVKRMRVSPRSEGDARAQGPDARNRVAAKVEAAVGGRRLERAQSAGIRAEEIDLRVVPAVLGPHPEIAPGQREVDAVAEILSHDRSVYGVAGRELAQLHERSILDPVLEDALRPGVESGRQLARIAIRQQLALVLLRVT